MKTKLSAAQKKVLDEATRKITEARSCSTYEEYFNLTLLSETNPTFFSPDNFKFLDPKGYQNSLSLWENLKQGIVTTYCNTKTLQKLEALGYIEILKDANRIRYGLDTIKVINI